MASKELKETIPKTLMDKLYQLQDFMDEKTKEGGIQEGSYLQFCGMMMGQNGEEGISGEFREIIDKLSRITTEVRFVRERKEKYGKRACKLTRAQKLKKALEPADPNNPIYVACERCSRVVEKKRLINHQENTLVCEEVWLGRDSTINNPVRDGKLHLRYIAPNLGLAEYDPVRVPDVPDVPDWGIWQD